MKTRVAAIQTQTGPDLRQNVDAALGWVDKAAAEGAQLVVLPENFATLGLSAAQKELAIEVYEQGPIQTRLAAAAKANQIYLIAGAMAIKNNIQDKQPFASCLLFSPKGKIIARYDKVHLFDVKVAGKDEYRESATIQAGQAIQVVDTPIGKIGLTICYDLRFPELFRSMMLQGAQIMIVPAAFTIPTGQAHWEILLRARAIENLCYIIAAGECGARENGLGTYGHSMIINPWGEVLAKMETDAGYVMAELDFDFMQKIREEFPAISNYRPFVLESLLKKR